MTKCNRNVFTQLSFQSVGPEKKSARGGNPEHGLVGQI